MAIVTKQQDVTTTLARSIVATRYESLPPEAVAAVKGQIQDALGLTLVGSIATGCPELAAFALDAGGVRESTVLVHGRKVPVAAAAMVNSAFAHAWDYDDTDDRTGNHLGAISVPAALAAAEARGGVSGKELITAVCVGSDLGARVLAASREILGKGPTTAATAPFVAAAAAGKVLGLDESQVAHAIGLAYAQVAFGANALRGPSLTKRLKAGLGCRGGVEAALLARRGVTASLPDTFEGAHGFYQIFYGRDGDMERLCAGHGQDFEVANLSIKPYPCCRVNHGALDCLLSLVRDQHIQPSDVEGITVWLTPRGYAQLGGGGDPARIQQKRHPVGVIDSQFSIYWTLSTAILKGKVTVSSFTDAALTDPETNKMTERVTCLPREALVAGARAITPARVEIRTKQGQAHTRELEFAWGHPSRPFGQGDLDRKFRENAAYAARPIAQKRVEQALDQLHHLEDVADVSVFARLLTGR